MELCASTPLGFLLFMTRLERKEKELNDFYKLRAAALKTNNLLWLSQNKHKIDALEKEVIAMRSEAKRTMEEHKQKASVYLKDLLEEKGEDVKNRFYVGMLRISMLSDAVNEACEEVKSLMKNELNVVDFSLRKEVSELASLSQKIASFVCRTGSPILEDCIVNDDKFVDACMKLATKHITSKLKIKTKI